MSLKIRLFVLLLGLTYFVNAQKNEDKVFNFTKIDMLAKSVPVELTADIDTLAAVLSSFSNKPRDKARAIYVWISSHITYDYALLDSLSSPWANVDNVRTQDPENVLWTRKAVCQGYAELFKALADRMKLRCEVVVGAVKDQNGEIPRIGHAWNSVKIGTEWELIDATWGANSDGVINEKYFFTPAETLIIDHLPFDPMWQLTENPLTFELFKTSTDKEVKKKFGKSAKNEFVFKDTISRYFRQDTLIRLLKSSDRMLRFNPDNEYVIFEVGKANYYRFIQMSDKLNNRLSNALISQKVEMDSARFESRIAAKWAYYNKAWQCYQQIKDNDFQQKVKEGVFTLRQIEGLKQVDRGLYYTTVFNAKSEIENKTQLGIIGLDRYVHYSFNNFRNSIAAFDTLAKTKFNAQYEAAIYYPCVLKLNQAKNYIVYIDRFLDYDEHLLKNKAIFKYMLGACEQHIIEGQKILPQMEILDSTKVITKKYEAIDFYLDLVKVKFDAQIEYLEEHTNTKGYSLENIIAKEALYEDLNFRLKNLKENLKKDIFNGYEKETQDQLLNIEMLNNLGVAQIYLMHCEIDNSLTSLQKNKYITDAESYLQKGEAHFKTIKNANPQFYKINQAFIDNFKNKIAKLKGK